MISERLLRRECLRSTIPDRGGIALPHAQVSGLRAPVAAPLRALRAMRMAAADGPLVQDFLVLLVPKPAAVPHFELRARLAQLLRDPTQWRELALGKLPLNVLGILSNDRLLAIPCFKLIGAILEKCRLAGRRSPGATPTTRWRGCCGSRPRSSR
jgi:hypothetical protein